jgi:asparagine synthase (glutamine-hydrolysing)
LSAIFGIINRDGCPLAPHTLDGLRFETADWGRDGGGALCDGTAGLGLALSLNTPEARFECLPSTDASGLMFTAAGRVDNRAELARELRLGAQVSRLGDGALMHRAWLRWGDSCPVRIFGDWAFAAWNPATRRLYLARDHSGNTAIYYYADSRFFAFSSSRRALLKLDLPPIEMDELHLARHLVSWNRRDGEGTIHKQIKRLPPAHFLTVTPERVEVRQYWHLEATQQLLLPRRTDYIPAFLDVFDRAVRDCLRSDFPIAATLSGGLDSSSVAVTAAHCLRAEGQRLRAFTSIPGFGTAAYTGSMFGDELPFARAAAAAAGNIDLETIDAAGLSPIIAIRRALEISLDPKHGACNMFWLLELRRIAAAAGCRTLLIGSMGNGSISWTGDAFSQPLAGQIRILGWRRWLRGTVQRHTPQPLLAWRRHYKRTQEWLRETAIHPDFARRLDLIGRYMDDPRERSPQPAMLQRCRLINPGSSFSGAAEAEMGAAAGLEIRDPTADVRVLAFCFSIPDTVFMDSATGLDRWLIREAMKGRLPENVRMNRRRGRQAADLVPRLRNSAEDVERALAEIEGGPAAEYVSVPAMREAWHRARTEDTPEAFLLAVTILTRGIMAGLFVNGFGIRW